MQILNKSANLTRPAHTSAQSRKNYSIWLSVQFSLIFIIAVALTIEGFLVYRNTLKLLNSSNQYMMDKAGIEASTEINQNGLKQTELIMDKKQKPPTPPEKLRNIFQFDSYAIIYTGGIVAPATSSTTATTSISE
ncbi:MAG: hypothetical protein WC457_01565 [Patescibacteria group bacterium]